jgi:hypothetical protein
VTVPGGCSPRLWRRGRGVHRGAYRNAEWTPLASCLRDEHPAHRHRDPRRRPLLNPAGQLTSRLRPQRHRAVDTGRVPTGILLRDPPHRHQSVGLASQHQPLQTADLTQLPIPRRREDPLPQTPYFLLGCAPINQVQSSRPFSGPFTAIVVAASNLPIGSSAVVIVTFTGSPDPRQRPLGPRQPPLSGRLSTTTSGSLAMTP